MTDPGASDADRILDMDLPHSFRGLDPEAVQDLLTDAVGSLREAQRREEELRATVGELEAALAEARSDATAELEQARARGRQMVTEAQTVRRRILEDLIRRRKVLRRQIEQLRVGRERLLEAYEVVGHNVEEATAELGVALPAAQAAAERAGRRLGPDNDEVSAEELHAMDAEIDAARVAGLPILDPPSAAERVAAATDRDEGGPHSGEVPPLTEVEPTLAAFEEMRVLGPVSTDDPGPGEATAEVEDETAPGAKAAAADESAPEPAHAVDEALTLPLFDRLRAGEAEPESVPEADSEAMGAADAIEAAPPEEPEPEVDPAALLADDLARRLRRALADEQNQVLDHLRQDRRGRLGLDDVLGDTEAQVARLATAVEPRLREAAAEWGTTPEGGVAGVATRLAGLVADGVRADIDRQPPGNGDDAGPDGSSTAITRRVREAFRAWRTDRILPMAAEAAAEVIGP